MDRYRKRNLIFEIIGFVGIVLIFVTPFMFLLLNSLKDRKEANLLNMTLPDRLLWENYVEVFQADGNILLTGLKNSTILTVGSILLLILFSSMAAYVIQRRGGKAMEVLNGIIMLGLMVPPAILPTIWVMQGLNLYKTMFGMCLVEVALQTPFSIMLYRGFIASIPIELEEAGYIDGCTSWKLFRLLVFPLLKPVTSTIIILNAVTVFNDFANPLYFLPGKANITVQQTLYNFTGKFLNSYNLLFANVVVITLPLLLVFIFFNKKIIDGMTMGAVKG